MGENITITLLVGGESKTLTGPAGETIQKIIASDDDTIVEAPCGGKGRCGKCKVKIVDPGAETLPEAHQEEIRLLSEHEIAMGVRLSCLTRVEHDVTVEIKEKSAANILVHGVDYDTPLLPNVRKTAVVLDSPSLEDQRDDLTRLQNALDGDYNMPLAELMALPETLRANDYRVTAVHDRNFIITVEPGDTSGKNYGIAVDIGTTTVVAYLIDLSSGDRIDVAAGLNAQKSHGQDVISRINFTLQEKNGIDLLRTRIINQINEIIQDLVKRNDIEISNIYSITLAGNTTMMHLASGLPPAHIAKVPFIPVANKRMTFLAEDLGFDIPKGASAFLLPGISAYVGADIVSAILASGLYYGEALSLLIDIGTNGEIVLGDRNRMRCCSTAAGPAFEGATIRNGVGGITGAIDSVSMENKSFSCTTIGDAPALGICGSGIIDAVAVLLDSGLVDETGRMEPIPGYETILTEIDEQPAVVLMAPEHTESGEAIVLTQRDVREVQLAKASFAAGIQTLLLDAKKSEDDVDVVYLAGGFGSFIDKANAIRIGLIPESLVDKVEVIGNAAGTGAVLSLMSEECITECDRIANSAVYIELSSSLEFQTAYVDQMSFPDHR